MFGNFGKYSPIGVIPTMKAVATSLAAARRVVPQGLVSISDTRSICPNLLC